MAALPFKAHTGRQKRARQQTIEDVLRGSRRKAIRVDNGRENEDYDSDDSNSEDALPMARRRVPRVPVPVPGSAARRRAAVVDSSDNDDDEKEEEEEEEGTDATPTTPATAKRRTIRIPDSDDDEDGIKNSGQAGSNSDSDSDDVRPAKRRRANQRPSARDNSGSPSSSLLSDIVTVVTPPSAPLPSSSGSILRSSARKSGGSRRTQRQRHLELLRRRRLGEKVTESDVEEEEEAEAGGATVRAGATALYDKDPDYVALSEFEDEEEDEKEEVKVDVSPGQAPAMDDSEGRDSKGKRKKEKKDKEKKKKKSKTKNVEPGSRRAMLDNRLSSRFDEDDEDDGYDYSDRVLDSAEEEAGEEDDDDMADFIDDSPAGLLGAPDGGGDAEAEQAMLRREMPLQFTFQAHKPLRSHFKDAVEWLVQRRLAEGGRSSTFPGSDDELYRVAWDRLDREVDGLAQSRFISSSWTPAFYGALVARPYMESIDMRPPAGSRRGGGGSSLLLSGLVDNVCHACGRTNHPASFRVLFSGKAYDRRTLDDVDEDEDEDAENEPIDVHGNAIAPTSRQWYVGAVCHSNAETAHDLLHWRRALQDWVEDKLAADGVLAKLGRKEDKKRKKNKALKPHKRQALANKTVDAWEANGTVRSLFRDFSKMLEGAQAKSTKTLSRYGR